MKFVKVILLLAILLVGVWIVLCFVGPAAIRTERSVQINAQPEVVFGLVNDLQVWEAWSPWQGKDSTMVTTLTNPSIGMGATMSWTSRGMGNGSMQITQSQPFAYIATTLVFSDFDGESYANFTFKKEGEGTEVTWNMDGSEIPFLVRGFLALMDPISEINKDYDEGLAALKTLAESQPPLVIEEPILEETGETSDGEIIIEDATGLGLE
ncbi:MAG: SRPBCC family protein [Flavobacteriales bacterium]|jgi:hypothetical protein